jgi:hypothetical protein
MGFILRLLFGLLKGIVLGALIGYGLAAAGVAVPSALIAYPVAAGLGMLLALVAGKPIWAKGARIEVGMKAAAGALVVPGMLWLIRRFLTMGVPFDLPSKLGFEPSGATLGMFGMTGLAMAGAVLAGFFDADNQPGAKEEGADKTSASEAKKRIATTGGAASEADESAAEPAQRKMRK